MAVELNADGLAVQYGAQPKGGAHVASPETDGIYKEIVLDINPESINASVVGSVMGVPAVDLPARSDIFSIPVGSIVKEMIVDTVQPLVGGTVTATLVNAAGAAVALGGAAVATAGAVVGNKATVTAGTAANAVALYLDAKATGVITAGIARVTVRYI